MRKSLLIGALSAALTATAIPVVPSKLIRSFLPSGLVTFKITDHLANYFARTIRERIDSDRAELNADCGGKLNVEAPEGDLVRSPRLDDLHRHWALEVVEE